MLRFLHACSGFTVWKTTWVAPKLCTAFPAPLFEVCDGIGKSLQYEFASCRCTFQGANDSTSL